MLFVLGCHLRGALAEPCGLIYDANGAPNLSILTETTLCRIQRAWCRFAFGGRRPSGTPPRPKAVIDGSPAGSGCESMPTRNPQSPVYLRAFVEKTPTRHFARHNGFAAEPLMEPEVGAETGAAHG